MSNGAGFSDRGNVEGQPPLHGMVSPTTLSAGLGMGAASQEKVPGAAAWKTSVQRYEKFYEALLTGVFFLARIYQA